MEKTQIRYFSIIFLALFAYLALDSIGIFENSNTSQKSNQNLNYSMPRVVSQSTLRNNYENQNLQKKTGVTEKKNNQADTITIADKKENSNELNVDVKKVMKLADNMKANKELKKKGDNKKVAESKKSKNITEVKGVFAHQKEDHSLVDQKNDLRDDQNVTGDSFAGMKDSNSEMGVIGNEVNQEGVYSQIPSIDQLLQNYKNKKINDDVFYGVLELMLLDQNKTSQSQVLQALYANYSSKSFMFISRNKNKLSSQNLSKAQSYILSYGSFKHAPYLLPVLNSRQEQAIVDASQAFLSGVRLATRSRSQIVKDQYLRFNGTFKILSQNSNGNISNWAQQILKGLDLLKYDVKLGLNS